MRIENQAVQAVNNHNLKTDYASQVSTHRRQTADSVNVPQPSVSNVNALQQEIFRSNRLFGALSVLADSIEIFQREPSTYEQNVKAAIEKLQKDFPQLTVLKENSNVSQAVDKMRTEIGRQMSQDKKALASYIISEQNKNAALRTSISSQDVSGLAGRITYNPHTPRTEQVSQLLS